MNYHYLNFIINKIVLKIKNRSLGVWVNAGNVKAKNYSLGVLVNAGNVKQKIIVLGFGLMWVT